MRAMIHSPIYYDHLPDFRIRATVAPLGKDALPRELPIRLLKNGCDGIMAQIERGEMYGD